MIATIFAGLSGLLLAIASANIATVQLARATARSREVASGPHWVPGADASFGSFFPQSVVLAVLGGGAAIPLAFGASRLLETTLQASGLPVPVGVDFSLDWRVIAVCWAVALLAGKIAGLAPALYTFRADINSLLKVGGFVSSGAGGMRVQRGLIVAQIAVSLALLIFGGLFARTLSRAQTIDLGFRTADVIVAHVDLRSQGYDEARRRAYLTESQERIAALPGVRHASWASGLPFGYSIGLVPVHAAGVATNDERPPTAWTLTLIRRISARCRLRCDPGGHSTTVTTSDRSRWRSPTRRWCMNSGRAPTRSAGRCVSNRTARRSKSSAWSAIPS